MKIITVRLLLLLTVARDTRATTATDERDDLTTKSDSIPDLSLEIEPDSVRSVDVGFVPETVYTQVRRHDVVRHLPRSAAADDAVTYEEVVNAPRLREALVQKKIQQVYEEKGYEDSGYDHGGYNHHGSKYEDKDANESQEVSKKESDSLEATNAPKKAKVFSFTSRENQEADRRKLANVEASTEKQFVDPESSSTRQISDLSISRDDDKTSRIQARIWNSKESIESTDSDKDDESVEGRVMSGSKGSASVSFPGMYTRRQYLTRPSDDYIQDGTRLGIRQPIYGMPAFLPVLPFPSYYSDHSMTTKDVPQRISFKRINHMTTRAPSLTSIGNTGPVKFLVAAETLNTYATLLRPADKPEGQNYAEVIQPRFNSSVDIDTVKGSSTRRRPSKFRYPVANGRGRHYDNFTRNANYSNIVSSNDKIQLEVKNPSPHTRHPSIARDNIESSDESSVHELISATSFHRQDPVKYIEQLTSSHFTNVANVPTTLPPARNERIQELARQLNARSEKITRHRTPRTMARQKRTTYDENKYPFYSNLKGLLKNSALRYASNPDDVPKKTQGGMEFYESRDQLVRCEEPSPPDDVVPDKSEDGEWNSNPVPQNLPRIKGIGRTIKCLKVKYFGKDPLDSPFFNENSSPELDDVVEFDREITSLKRPARSADVDRVMVLPITLNRTNPKTIGHKYDDYNGFPFKNHKPETATVSQSVEILRASSPYKYDSYLPVRDNRDNLGEDSKRKKYYRHKYNHQIYHRHRRPYRPYPIPVYSIVAASNDHPVYKRPNSPMAYNIETTREPMNNRGSYLNSGYPPAPTRWYFVRPGEYTENKDLIADSKPAGSSIWDYINPLRWWFPSYFDQRRGEPKYVARRNFDQQSTAESNTRKRRSSEQWNSLRTTNEESDNQNERTLNIVSDQTVGTFSPRRRHRSSEQELFNRILARTNNNSIEPKVFESFKMTSSDQQKTTSAPISLQEFKAKFGVTSKSKQKSTKENRLSGGFVLRKAATSSTPASTYSIDSSSYTDNISPFAEASTTPMPQMSSTSPRPKVLFPRTKRPINRRPLTNVEASKSESRMTLTTTSTTTTPSTTTRMYKPKRIVNKKKFDQQTPIDAFSVLKRTTQPIDSMEASIDSESRSTEEEPRRLQQVEHRRVTQEEVIKTSFMPEKEPRNERTSLEQYSLSSSEMNPPHEESTTEMESPDSHTLTYVVDPSTGIGSWNEQTEPTQRSAWKPKRRFPKRHLDDLDRKQLNKYPTDVPYEQEPRSPVRSLKPRIREESDEIPNYDNVDHEEPKRQVPTGINRPNPIGKHVTRLSSSEVSEEVSEDDTRRYVNEKTSSPPVKFILDPGKRKYFYANV